MNSKNFKCGERCTCWYGWVDEVEVFVLVVMVSSMVTCRGQRRHWKSSVCYWFELVVVVGTLVRAGEEAGPDGDHGEL